MLTFQIIPAGLNEKIVSFTLPTLNNGIIVYHGIAVVFKICFAAVSSYTSVVCKTFFLFSKGRTYKPDVIYFPS